MRISGKLNTTEQVCRLLETTNITIPNIAYRLGVTKETVRRINQTKKIRQYPRGTQGGMTWIRISTGETVEAPWGF